MHNLKVYEIIKLSCLPISACLTSFSLMLSELCRHYGLLKQVETNLWVLIFDSEGVVVHVHFHPSFVDKIST